MIGYETEPLEWEEDPLGEARRSRPVAQPRGVHYRPQLQPQAVTKGELQAVSDRIDRDAAATRTGLQQLTARIDALAAAQAKTRQDGRQQNDMSLLLPLLMRPKLATEAEVKLGLQPNEKFMIDTGDKLSMILPFLLSGNLGSSGSAGGGDNSLMMAAMMIAFSK